MSKVTSYCLKKRIEIPFFLVALCIDFVYLIKVLILLNLIKQKKTKKSSHHCNDFRIYILEFSHPLG